MKRLGWVVGGLAIGVGLWFYKAFQDDYGPYGNLRRMACKGNLNRMAKAAILYSEDYDDRLMPSDRWMDCLVAKSSTGLKYNGVEEMFHCPCGPRARTDEVTRSGGPYGYAYNSDLAGKRKSEFELPEHTPLIYESKKFGRNAADRVTSFSGPYDPDIPGSQRANIAYLAGFVERSVRDE